MSLQEYEIDSTALHEWLPWGGLTHENAMRNKDDSFFGIIKYDAIPSTAPIIQDMGYKKGWVLWSEKQHDSSSVTSDNFLVLCWNPFISKLHSDVENVLQPKKVPLDRLKEYFVSELKRLATALSAVTSASVLRYEEILNFLSFSLTIQNQPVQMPAVPMYLDAYLTENMRVDFLENDILINKRRLIALSLVSCPSAGIVNSIFKALEKTNYRYTQRLLVFDHKSAAKAMSEYTSKWFPRRKYVKKVVLHDLHGKLNGYYTSTFLFLAEKDNYENIIGYLQNIMDILEIPYILENYNLKDVWWGNFAGVFRANIVPPVTGFASLNELLITAPEVEEDV